MRELALHASLRPQRPIQLALPALHHHLCTQEHSGKPRSKEKPLSLRPSAMDTLDPTLCDSGDTTGSITQSLRVASSGTPRRMRGPGATRRLSPRKQAECPYWIKFTDREPLPPRKFFLS